MDHRLDKIEEKLDKLLDRLDAYNARMARVETSQSWIKWAFPLILTASVTASAAFAKYIGN